MRHFLWDSRIMGHLGYFLQESLPDFAKMPAAFSLDAAAFILANLLLLPIPATDDATAATSGASGRFLRATTS